MPPVLSKPPVQPPADGAQQPVPPAYSGPPVQPGYPAYPGQPAHAGQPPYPGQPVYPGQPAYPGYPVYPAQPAAARRRGLRTGIAVALAAAVLASIGVGVYALAGDDGGGDRAGSGQQDPRPGGPDGQGGPFGDEDGGTPPSPGPSEPPKVDSGSVTDPLSGISLPIPDGWYGQELSYGAQVTSDDAYRCPGDTSKTCTKGGAYSAPAMLLETEGDTAEEVAKADIEANARESYGGKTYGSITSHEVLASKAVTVAGQKGYLVRWKAVTSKGADGYVESLAFPSPRNPEQIVVVRFGVDTTESQSVLDDIAKGIKAASGGGSGQDV
ncbi:hypothetical protein [Streptomyces cyaneogriseus]|nr:hypothetical protein [Streptomyces cyaneogriseus]